MSTTNSPDPNDLIARVVDAFERMPVPLGPSLREAIDLIERAVGRGQIAPSGWRRTFNHGREMMRRPLPRLMLAAAVGLVVVAIWLLVPGQQSAAQAFNKFAKALVEAHSAAFQMEVSIAGQEREKARGYYLAPGKMRNEIKKNGMEVVTIFDTKAGKMVSLNPEKKTALVVNMKDRPNEPGNAEINDIFERMRNLLAEGRDAKEDDIKRLGEKEIDGRRAIGFSFANAAESVTLWGDPATGLPVLVETIWSGTPKMQVTMSHVELNDKLDPALFDTAPPADYKVQAFDVDASKPNEAVLIEMLRISADANDGRFIDSLDTASFTAITEKIVDKMSHDKKDKSKGVPPQLMSVAMTMGRGMVFALYLPESADAHYAGKGVKFGEADRPIFWYMPEGAKTYRVIYADLTVKDAEGGPEVAGAVRLEKMKLPGKQDQKVDAKQEK